MSRFLSAEWVGAFNDALEGVDLAAAGADSSMVAGAGHFRIAQVVLGPPPDVAQGASMVRTVLSMDDGRISLSLHAVAGPVAGAGDPAAGVSGGDDVEPGALDVDGANVTVVLSYDDAAALSRAELDPVIALSTGRVKVRGDLSVLVAGQAVLTAAAVALADLRATTTY
jgi:hypothetical protein